MGATNTPTDIYDITIWTKEKLRWVIITRRPGSTEEPLLSVFSAWVEAGRERKKVEEISCRLRPR